MEIEGLDVGALAVLTHGVKRLTVADPRGHDLARLIVGGIENNILGPEHALDVRPHAAVSVGQEVNLQDALRHGVLSGAAPP